MTGTHVAPHARLANSKQAPDYRPTENTLHELGRQNIRRPFSLLSPGMRQLWQLRGSIGNKIKFPTGISSGQAPDHQVF
jgi:hypothetical protein